MKRLQRQKEKTTWARKKVETVKSDLHSQNSANPEFTARRTDIELVFSADTLPLLLLDIPDR